MSGCGFNPSPYLVRQFANNTIEVLPSRLQENKNHLGAPFSPLGSRHIQFGTFGPSPRPPIFNQATTASQKAHSPAPSLICTRYETQYRPGERPGFFAYQALPIQSILRIQQRRHQPWLKRQDGGEAYMAHWPWGLGNLEQGGQGHPCLRTFILLWSCPDSIRQGCSIDDLLSLSFSMSRQCVFYLETSLEGFQHQMLGAVLRVIATGFTIDTGQSKECG